MVDSRGRVVAQLNFMIHLVLELLLRRTHTKRTNGGTWGKRGGGGGPTDVVTQQLPWQISSLSYAQNLEGAINMCMVTTLYMNNWKHEE